MTTALEGSEWSAARPRHTLPPGKTRYPLYRRLGGPQGRSERAENLAPPGFDPRTVQHVVSRYTNGATRLTNAKILEGSEWSVARPGHILPPGKTRYTLYRRLGGPQGLSGRAENLAPPGFDPRAVQYVVSRYTDGATRPTNAKILT